MSERFDNTVPAEASANDAGATVGAGLPRIALLYTDEALLAHVEQTLAALRVPIVYRAALAQADHSALTDAHPEIALINLDDRCGEELDALTATLDAASVPIVFNDADISNRLEGWARARWARHLCAKLCGKDDVDPPRPMPDAAEQLAKPSASLPPLAGEGAPACIEAGADGGNTGEVVAVEPASAPTAVPLTQNEIDSLVADFPSETTAAGADTEALSAHIDALLANAADSASHEPAPWDVVDFADETEQPAPAPVAAKAGTPAAASAPVRSAPAPARSAAAPAIEQWQLVDDFTPVAPAAKAAEAAPSTSFGSGLALELEPLDPMESRP